MKLMRHRVGSIAVMVFVLALGASCSVLAASVSLLGATGHVSVPMGEALLAGAPASFVIAVIATVAYVQTTRAAQRMHARARMVDALQKRVRIADEVAERHRRTAENASAGMFELLSGLVAAEEGARGQLAAELHDTVAQSLTTAQVLLCDRENPYSVQRASELIAEAEEQVRAVMARTTPPALREGDLARAVSGLRDDLRNRYALEVDLSWPAEAYPLPLVMAITVYRFFQEALLNVVKHAEVDSAKAQLWVDEEWVLGTVIDEGPGFDPAQVRSEGGRHVGLGLLRERARLIGGSLDVASLSGRGTTLTLRLPRSVSASNETPLRHLNDAGWDWGQPGSEAEDLAERGKVWSEIAAG
jgi:signal transduction histidine kinase